MGNGHGQASAVLLGSTSDIGIERGLAEFRAGRPVLIRGSQDRFVALPIDGAGPERVAAFRQICAPAGARLLVTARRAKALGAETALPQTIVINPCDDHATLLALATSRQLRRPLRFAPAPAAAAAAIALAKYAERLPALLISDPAAPPALADDPELVAVDAAAVSRLRDETIRTVSIVSEAKVPLKNGLATRFVVFRDGIGGSSVAIIVDDPDFTKPVAVRLHSACLTGDVFGSRRCDCGDQLNLALARLHEAGGGVILYLDQEGRGLGLANKMRAYSLQDCGLDTVDANTALGFDDDERDYGVAARMLDLLGCQQVSLLTNNPGKLDGLVEAGIDIVERVALHTPINADNRRYLAAKAARAGHMLDELLTETDEQQPAEREPGLAPLA